ncbi:MAG: DnaB-like helicase N-terminal domain-containing protein, partial [Candidatus Aenigmatarchaeota archaeon]
MNIYDIESEEQVLCSFLLNPELLYQVDLRPYHFSDSEYRAIYTAMLKLYADGISIDFKTLKDADSSIKTST